MELKICVTASRDYITHLPVLLKSLFIAYPFSSALVALVNVDLGSRTWLENWLKAHNIKNKTEFKEYYQQFDSIDSYNGYCSNLRAELLAEAAFSDSSYFGYIDVNTIILPKFCELVNKLQLHDAIIILDEAHSAFRQSAYSVAKARKLARQSRMSKHVGPLNTILKGCCLAGLQLYKKTHATQDFALHYAQLVSRHPNTWFADQESLAILYITHRGRMRFHLLPEQSVGMGKSLPIDLFAIYNKNGRHRLYSGYCFYLNHFRSKQISLEAAFALKPIEIYSANPLSIILEKVHVVLMQKLNRALKVLYLHLLSSYLKAYRTLFASVIPETDESMDAYLTFNHLTVLSIFNGLRSERINSPIPIPNPSVVFIPKSLKLYLPSSLDTAALNLVIIPIISQ